MIRAMKIMAAVAKANGDREEDAVDRIGTRTSNTSTIFRMILRSAILETTQKVTPKADHVDVDEVVAAEIASNLISLKKQLTSATIAIFRMTKIVVTKADRNEGVAEVGDEMIDLNVVNDLSEVIANVEIVGSVMMEMVLKVERSGRQYRLGKMPLPT